MLNTNKLIGYAAWQISKVASLKMDIELIVRTFDH